MGFEFVSLEKIDKQKLINTLRAYFNDVFSNALNDCDFNSFVDKFEINLKISFLCLDNNNLIGIFLASMRGDKGYIANISIVEGLKNKGYGRVVLQKGINLFHQNGCKFLILDVLQENKIALSLYRSEGFEIQNEIYHYVSEKKTFSATNLSFYSMEKTNPFNFHQIYINFGRENTVWQKSLSGLLINLNNKQYELFLLRNKRKIEGYAIINRDDYSLKINALGLKYLNENSLSTLLSLLPAEEKKIQIRNVYKNEKIIEIVEKIGFSIENKQYQMIKKLL